MRLLVCGSRDYRDRNRLNRTLDGVAGEWKIDLVIEGEATGADTLARQWAASLHLPVAKYPADWTQGPKAGPERNKKMLAEGKPDLVVAFVTADKTLTRSRGTYDMVKRARIAGVRVIVVGEDDSRVAAR